MNVISKQINTDSADKAKQAEEAHVRNPHGLTWAEVLVWLERMSCRRRALPARPALVTASSGQMTRPEPSRMPGCSHFTWPASSETVSMQKPPTGEPYAGKPPVRFGGRGGESHPDPYHDDGKLLWGRLTHSRVIGLLKNPSYAGRYVFGRYQSRKQIAPSGEISTSCRRRASPRRHG